MAATIDDEEKRATKQFKAVFDEMKVWSCMENHDVHYDKYANEMVIRVKDGTHRYRYHAENGLRDLAVSGFRVSDKWACRGQHITALSMSKPSLHKGSSQFMILFCDDIKKEIIGILPVVYHNRDAVEYVEIFSCDLSKDQTILGFVIGILLDGDPSTQVQFYDTNYWLPVRIFEGQSMIPPAFAFHPSYKHSMVLLMGLDDEPQIELLSLETGALIQSSSIDFYDIDGETSLQLTFTADGCYIVCQVIENLGYNTGYMGRSYILDSRTFSVITKPKAVLAPFCHKDCDPQTLPVFSPGFRQMALLGKGQSKSEVKVNVYRFPRLLSLKGICRQEINESRTGEVGVLNVSQEMQNYLSYRPVLT